jgi:hypothetical protein
MLREVRMGPTGIFAKVLVTRSLETVSPCRRLSDCKTNDASAWKDIVRLEGPAEQHCCMQLMS